MRLGEAVNLLLSIGGLIMLLVPISVWLIVRPASRAARVCLAALVAFYAVVSTYSVPHAVGNMLAGGFKPLERSDVPPGRTLVLLLGSGNFTEFDWGSGRAAALDPHGLARAVEAARVYRLVDPVSVMCSGGRIRPGDPDVPIAQTMRDALVQMGVPASRIIAREGASDTHDEALMTARTLPSLHVDHVVLVTSGYHMPRAIRAFHAAGIAVIPAPARDEGAGQGQLDWQTRLLPSPQGLQEARVVGHEILGLAYYQIRGWR